MGGRRLIYIVCLLAAIFAAVLLVSCGGDSQSTQQADTASVSTKDSSTSKTARTGTSTNGRTGTSTSGDAAKRHSSVPKAEEIQKDLIGESITDPELGKWTFEDESEFLEFTIEDEDVSDSRTTFIVDMKLKDIGDGRIYNGQAKVIYKKSGRFWEFSSVTGEYRSGGPSI